MIPEQILKKAAAIKKIDCRQSSDCSDYCPLYKISKSDIQFIIKPLYRFLFGCERNGENGLSLCSEVFLSICFKYNKEKTRILFDKYKKYNGRINFYSKGDSMPCNLLKEMANFIIKSSTCLDIE